ncbi:hypothetical protein [Pseudomonas sp. BRM28]|uniref:hypothetical protein n=1 Tax=Pseudomonas sp. BRM28 TaxID=2045201 RepID=UPI000CEE2923|nr:hypothetical protein [Pseudomonas sp. BRM28]PPS61821.1 hypothetical protein CR917_12925 [Pseudomonas sp. BRM28]
METIFNFFQSFLRDFTWSKLTFLIVVIAISVGGLIAYEIYTSHFKLSRMNSELKVIQVMVELEQKVALLPAESVSKKYFERLTLEAEKKPFNLNIQHNFPSHKFERIFYQALPWGFMFILAALFVTEGKSSALGGISLIAAPFIIVGYNLPSTDSPWIVNYLYPWGAFVGLLFCILYFQRDKT